MTLRSQIDRARFADIFLDVYLSGGLGSLSKREIDLLVLRALIEASTTDAAQAALANADPFYLGRECRVRATRMRSMLDELRYRNPPTDEDLRTQLRDQLTRGERIADGTTVRIQIEDGLLRDYARKVVRDDFGVVDSSFDRAIIALSPAKFLALVLAVLGPDARTEFETQLTATKPGTVPAPIEGRLTWIFKKMGEAAAGEVGKRVVQLSDEWLRANGASVAGTVQELAAQIWKLVSG
ncbi:hypothetical protein [Falsiroseomonas bella]|uniref:hypothetical protein n=1 Tax=Falsiroseomonas bella TaxID=2184016 RepID=UPI0011B5E607|nr:hypothetical protein [Falsiroseomonas bella]